MNSPAWRWIGEAAALAIHDEQVAEHGGLAGIRDLDLVRSALARPQQLDAYGESPPDAAALAAAYAYGIARNHGFLDGNKRTAFVMALVFLLDHGCAVTASDADCVRVMLSVASGDWTEAALAEWLRQNIDGVE